MTCRKTSIGSRKKEFRAAVDRGFHPDAPVIALYDLLADGETDAGPFVLFVIVQTLEDAEDLPRILRIDPDAVLG
jgi:hypothetical protein